MQFLSLAEGGDTFSQNSAANLVAVFVDVGVVGNILPQFVLEQKNF